MQHHWIRSNRETSCVIQPVPVQIPADATRWFSVFASHEASQLDRYFTSFSVPYLIRFEKRISNAATSFLHRLATQGSDPLASAVTDGSRHTLRSTHHRHQSPTATTPILFNHNHFSVLYCTPYCISLIRSGNKATNKPLRARRFPSSWMRGPCRPS